MRALFVFIPILALICVAYYSYSRYDFCHSKKSVENQNIEILIKTLSSSSCLERILAVDKLGSLLESEPLNHTPTFFSYIKEASFEYECCNSGDNKCHEAQRESIKKNKISRELSAILHNYADGRPGFNNFMFSKIAESDSLMLIKALFDWLKKQPNSSVLKESLEKLFYENDRYWTFQAAKELDSRWPQNPPRTIQAIKAWIDNPDIYKNSCYHTDITYLLKDIALTESQASEVIPQLISLTDSARWEHAVGILGMFGAAAKSSIPALEKLLVTKLGTVNPQLVIRNAEEKKRYQFESDLGVKSKIAFALAKIDPKNELLQEYIQEWLVKLILGLSPTDINLAMQNAETITGYLRYGNISGGYQKAANESLAFVKVLHCVSKDGCIREVIEMFPNIFGEDKDRLIREVERLPTPKKLKIWEETRSLYLIDPLSYVKLLKAIAPTADQNTVVNRLYEMLVAGDEGTDNCDIIYYIHHYLGESFFALNKEKLKEYSDRC